MTKYADLHVHTSLSDGTFSPEKVVELASQLGLAAISITDHDCISSIGPAIEAGKSVGLEIIPGVELTVELEEDEVHILGYFIDWKDSSFVKKLGHISKIREERAKEILEKLKKHGIEITEEELFEYSGYGCVGRLHIANLLYKKGYINTVGEAFYKYIGNKGPCYVKKFKLSPKEAVHMIEGVGGIAVLAHPKTLNTKDRSIDDTLKLMIKDGIKGIEVYHSDHSQGDVIRLKEKAEKYNLVITGGSDCHGFAKKSVLLGKVKIPYDLVEKLKEAVHG